MTKESASAVRVQTIHQGELDVPEGRIVTFVSPLLGFERLTRFLIHQPQPGPLYWLQSVEELKVAFCLLAPFQAGLDPDIEITPRDVLDIGASGSGDIDVYTLVVLDKDPAQVRTNLRAPLLVGKTSGKAKQVVLDDARLPIRCFLKDLRPR